MWTAFIPDLELLIISAKPSVLTGLIKGHQEFLLFLMNLLHCLQSHFLGLYQFFYIPPDNLFVESYSSTFYKESKLFLGNLLFLLYSPPVFIVLAF